MRLDKFLAHYAHCSRKDAKNLIKRLRVCVNNVVCKQVDFEISEQTDVITVDDVVVNSLKDVYLMLHKPAGVVCARVDAHHQTVFDLLYPPYDYYVQQKKLHLIGRLDVDTEGLLLLTTNGLLTHKLISPKNHYDKTYLVALGYPVDASFYKKEINAGFLIPPQGEKNGFMSAPAKITFLSKKECESNVLYALPKTIFYDSLVLLTICEGKFHQIKRMFKVLGNEVVYLKRISFAGVMLDLDLLPGMYRPLRQDEISFLSDT